MYIPSHKLKKTFLDKIESLVGTRGYSTDDIDRLTYCRDSNFRSAIQAHYLVYDNFPAIIIWSESTEQLSKLIKIAASHKTSVTIVGGSSGVCGGAVPSKNSMIIDVKKMNNVLRVDEDRLFVEAEAGILGLQLEKELARKGYTLGHFPVSILNATLGGFLATRAAGQLSSKYGKIEDMVIDLEFIDGKGQVIQTADTSRGRGFDLTQTIVGSEGTLGIITKARLRIYPLPQDRVFLSYSFNNMEYGIEAQRRIIQTGMKPDVLRLYDKLDSAIAFSKISSTGLPMMDADIDMPANLKKIMRAFKSGTINMLFRYQRLVRDISEFSWLGCLLIAVLEGNSKVIEQKKKIMAEICEDMNAKDIGEDTASHWFKHRFSVAYKIPKLYLDGGFSDTIEVSTTWDNVIALYEGVLKRMRSLCLVLTHITHVYTDGASIYFTFVVPLRSQKQALKSYDKIWKTALDAVQEFGGTLSHHHGIGKLKTTNIKEEWGEAYPLYKELKDFFDPYRILNPGVLCVD